MGSLGLITAHISKARTPIKTDTAQYGLLGCHSEEQHIQHENQSHPSPPPHLLVRRSGLPAGDLRGTSDKYAGSIKGCGRGKLEKTREVVKRRQSFASPQSSCVCAGVCWGSEDL